HLHLPHLHSFPTRRSSDLPIEYPNVVLLLPGSPELFDRSKTASTVDQFVSKGDPRFTIGTLDSPPGHQRLSFPPKVRQYRHSVLGGADVAPVRLQLVVVLQRAARTDKRGLVPEGWIAVLDSHDTALDGGSARAEAASLPVQCPFAGKIRFLLRDAQTGKSEKDSAGDTCSNQHPCAPQSWIDPPLRPSVQATCHGILFAMGRGEKPKREKKKPKKK